MIGTAMARTQDARKQARRPMPLDDAERVKRFYSRKPVVLYSGQADDATKATAGNSYDLLKVKRVADDHLLIRTVTGQDYRLMEPPSLLAGVVAFDKSEAELVIRATEWLRRRMSGDVPTPHFLNPGDALGFSAVLLGSLRGVIDTLAATTTDLARQLADSRKINEEMQNQFAALESYIDRHGLQPFDCAFINEPSRDDAEPNVLAMAMNGRISQILPVASVGVSAVGFHVSKAAPRSDATLVVTLSSIEDGRQIETWSVPAAEIEAGWMTLSLRNAVTGMRRTLQVVIAVEGSRSNLPTLSLGTAQPLELFRLQDHDLRQSLTSASLALQVFVGLPGVAAPKGNGFSAQGDKGADGHGLREISLTPSQLGQTAQVHLDADAGRFDGVTYLDNERAISCHPPAFGTTIARIDQGCPTGCLRLSANLLVENAQSHDVEFAIVASPHEARVIDLLSGIAEPGESEGCSGWVRVPAKQPRFGSIYFSHALAGPSDLYLATRMADPGNHDFAWARFLNIHALVQG
ncbi:MAG: hypothetical protein JNL25_15070 [Rhodospirillaceae bacterium]|nr:hypothetical protein [Rhodospirillaceae bacterium]